MKYLISIFLLLTACATRPPAQNKETMTIQDPNLWLEEVESPKALEFAKIESDRTIKHFKKNPRFAKIETELSKIALAEDRLPGITLINGEAYNFWQDEKHVRGLWRKTSITDYKNKNPKWEIILDLDALAEKENENWVWKWSDCLPPEDKKCLITLSRGGKDASVVREFDLEKKEFVKDGFFLPEAKNHVAWVDQDTIYVGSDFGSGSLTDSGYPMISKMWKRGQPLSEAKEIFKGISKDMSVASFVIFTEKKNYRFHVRTKTFFDNEVRFENEKGQTVLLPLPASAQFEGVFDDEFLFTLREELKLKSGLIPAGSLVALPVTSLQEPEPLQYLEILFTPQEKRFLTSLSISKSSIYLNLADNVQGKIARLVHQASGSWQLMDLHFGHNGVASIYSTSAFDDLYLMAYTDFLTPYSIYFGSTPTHWDLLKHAPSRFDSKDMKIEQRESRSADGTIIPYFIVHKKNMKLDGKNPTILYGYGGFEIAMQPSYLESLGKVWVEKGGVYVLANIRGGGEFGPEWHQAVLREKRMKVYEDFISVAEDLIKNKITSPQHLGIQGRSNGGLLTGATFVKRPDLFNAVLCEVPLLDMIRYHKLLAGASWKEEYGDPDDPKMLEALLTYSPYQNVKAETKYPEVFFMTSTKDDRVHPGHARKMVARMKEQGHAIYYYENIEGGHAGNANISQKILWNSLEYAYLWEKLGSP